MQRNSRLGGKCDKIQTFRCFQVMAHQHWLGYFEARSWELPGFMEYSIMTAAGMMPAYVMQSRLTISTQLSATHLEEDLRYIPLVTNSLEMNWQSLEMLSALSRCDLRHTLGAPTAWEVMTPSGTLELNRPGILSGRPDQPSRPRIPPLLPGQRVVTGFSTYSGPIILGDMDVVISMPLDVMPHLGVRRDMMRFIPTLQQELRRIPRDYGHVAHLRVGRATRERHLFVIFDRADEYDLGDVQAWSAGTQIVLNEAHRQGINQLVMMRPPARNDLISWSDVFLLTKTLAEKRPTHVVFMRGQCQVDVYRNHNNNNNVITLPDDRVMIDDGLL